MNYGDFAGQGGGGMGGGGFLASPPGRALESSDPALSPNRKKTEGSRGSIVPVTIKMLGNAEKHLDDNFRIDNKEIQYISVVGLVKSHEATSTHMNYVIDDGTGSMDARKWVSEGDQAQTADVINIQNGMYVRIVGHLREFVNQRNILAVKINPVVDFNEVTHHMLDVIYVHKYTKFGPQEVANPAAAQTTTSTFGQGYNPPQTGAVPAQYTAPQNQQMQGEGGLSGCSNDVLNVVTSLSAMGRAERGVAVDDIIKQLINKFQESTIKQTVDFLVSEAHLFTTIDDNHVRRCS